MNDIIGALLNPWVLLYLFIIVLVQSMLVWRRRQQQQTTRSRRVAAGLPADNVLLDHKQKLSVARQDALVEATVLVGTVVATPFILLFFANLQKDPGHATGLATTFLILLLWVLFSNAELGKAWIGGSLFKLLIGFNAPFQVGDRVTLLGHSGKVIEIGSFLIKLQTPDDDLVSLPTSRLWSEPLVSANAGDRASLCVIEFYLSPMATTLQREQAEDLIWDSAQASVYFDFTKPLQIYLSQTEYAIVMKLKAYVASTYNEALFKSDITRAFLAGAGKNEIPLADKSRLYLQAEQLRSHA